jgi:hypothetical protein
MRRYVVQIDQRCGKNFVCGGVDHEQQEVKAGLCRRDRRIRREVGGGRPALLRTDTQANEPFVIVSPPTFFFLRS